MNIHHHPDLVRQFSLDGSFHCDVHGLLSDEEARDVLGRAGLTSEKAARGADRASRWPWSWYTAVVDATRRFRRPKCELLA